MSFGRRTITRPLVASAAVVVGALALAAMPVSSSADPSLGQLNNQLGGVQSREQSLASSIAGLSRLITSLDGQIALVESREAAVRADLARDRAQLAGVQRALTRERRVLAMLRQRLARARTLLARQLVSNYEQAKPNLVSVVLESDGFKDLLDKLTFLHDAQKQQQAIITITQQAKAQADAAAKHLAALEATDRQITFATAQRVRALAGMNLLLRSKQSALQQARSVKQQALTATRARGAALRSQIARIEAAQAAAARAAAAAAAAPSSSGAGGGPTPAGPTYGPSGGWAIPYSIVLCESGGQNLTPNSAGASGY
jgi:septal ring factor EnvC (AmiA/AmiB activator)